MCLLDYETLPDGTLDFQHTYTPPELRGRQIAYAITKFALDYAIQNNLKVIPTCPYVSDFINNNPEYKKVL
jgi:predicted GNAT family acetyltransferase